MPTIRGALRNVVFSPALAEVTFAKRGFPAAPSAATQQLEPVPQAVICGFEWGIEARNQWEVERRLSMVDPELRGFAYEGTTMAFTVLDAMGRGHRTRDLLLGPAPRTSSSPISAWDSPWPGCPGRYGRRWCPTWTAASITRS